MSDDTGGNAPESQVLAVPLNADGTIGTLPEPLQKLFDARIREVTQRAKAKTPDPVEVERLKTLEAENEQFRIKDAEAGKRYEEAIAIRESREKAERDRLQSEIERRTARLQRAAHADIKAAALQAGARDESIDELVALLAHKVSLNDDLDLVVDGADTIDALVAGYLDAKPHHRRSAGGQSMGATGSRGASAKTDGMAALQQEIGASGRLTGEHLRRMREVRQQTAS